MEKKDRNLKLVQEYVEGSSMTELVGKYNMHRSTIQKILKRYKVKLHKNKSLIKCDKNFFETYTKESCYWAGFILADGNLRYNRNSLQLKLGKIDKPHLINFLKAIKCDDMSLVKEYADYVSLTINLDEYKKALINNFGVEPRKTYSCDLSKRIPKKMYSHFIRGYFDGDGTITNTTIITIGFVGTKKFLGKMCLFYETDLDIKLKSKNATPPIQMVNEVIGSVYYYGKNAIKIMEFLYQDLSDNIFLERKLIKYFKLKKEYEFKRKN